MPVLFSCFGFGNFALRAMPFNSSLNVAQMSLAQVDVTLRRLQIRMTNKFRQTRVRSAPASAARVAECVPQIVNSESRDLAFPQCFPVRRFKLGHRLRPIVPGADATREKIDVPLRSPIRSFNISRSTVRHWHIPHGFRQFCHLVREEKAGTARDERPRDAMENTSPGRSAISSMTVATSRSGWLGSGQVFCFLHRKSKLARDDAPQEIRLCARQTESLRSGLFSLRTEEPGEGKRDPDSPSRVKVFVPFAPV